MQILRKGIDVSRWQGSLDWCKVSKDSNVQFAIVKAGGADAGLYTDSQFEANYYGAKGHYVPVGCYWFYSDAISPSDQITRLLEIIQGKRFEYPIYIDVEGRGKATKEQRTEYVKAMCNQLESAGYYVGIYGSDVATFRDLLDVSKLMDFDKWVARYPLESNNTVVTWDYGLRQHSSTGKISGINGKVDLDVAYYDFPQIMKKKHLNGF